MNTQAILLASLVILGDYILDYTEACSCMPSHPQKQYCESDFVILARVTKARRYVNSNKIIYKLKIKKEFKMAEKARMALKHNQVQTALDAGMCGKHLETKQVYVLSGRLIGLKAHINLCGFNEFWSSVTPRQKKGVKLLYQRGCDCKIEMKKRDHGDSKDFCSITNLTCYVNYGICLRMFNGECNWASCTQFQKCLKSGTKKKPIYNMARRYPQIMLDQKL